MKRAATIAAAVWACAGCGAHFQSATDPAGPQAARIAGFWWFMLALLGAIFLAVMVVMLMALRRTHRGFDQEPLERTHAPSTHTEERLTRSVAAATIATVIVLFGLVVVSVTTGKAVSQLGGRKDGMVVEVTGSQWWWSVRYVDDDPSRIVVTANESHIPVGRPVTIRGLSNDVIHSFWIPNLHGKVDLIPSRVTTETLLADRAGRFRGQCAEFCGLQHAHMALWVIADPPDRFETWMEQQRQPAAAPSTDSQMRGQQVFLSHACVFCHTIQGSGAAGQNAPDLTHFASRTTIAAGTLPNTRGYLGGWILDPQTIKPGNHMATIPIAAEDVQPLLDYLGSLR